MNAETYQNTNWSEVVFLALVYTLYIILITAPIGFVISALKVYLFKSHAEHADVEPNHEMVLIATHHEWLVRTFIGMLFMSMAALGLSYYLVGFIVAFFAVGWWLYRLIKGIVALVAHREMPAPICTKAQCYGQVAGVS